MDRTLQGGSVLIDPGEPEEQTILNLNLFYFIILD